MQYIFLTPCFDGANDNKILLTFQGGKVYISQKILKKAFILSPFFCFFILSQYPATFLSRPKRTQILRLFYIYGNLQVKNLVNYGL